MLTGAVSSVERELPRVLSVVPYVTVAWPALPSAADANTSSACTVLVRNICLPYVTFLIRPSSSASFRLS